MTICWAIFGVSERLGSCASGQASPRCPAGIAGNRYGFGFGEIVVHPRKKWLNISMRQISSREG
jgi:hypothetical protein